MSEKLAALDFGELSTVPVKIGGTLDQGRRKKVTEVSYDDDDVVVAVSRLDLTGVTTLLTSSRMFK